MTLKVVTESADESFGESYRGNQGRFMSSKKINILILIVITISFTSCAFNSRRFESVMDEGNDYRFFAPKRDFRVLAGDEGKIYRSEREMHDRTPYSEKEGRPYRYRAALKDELYGLESNENQQLKSEYGRYREKLGGTSERIYYLKLKSNRERNDYLNARGLKHMRGYNLRSPAAQTAIRNREIVFGMTKQAVKRSWGYPNRMEVAGNPANQNERWIFERGGTAHYVYFENGTVQGWQQN